MKAKRRRPERRHLNIGGRAACGAEGKRHLVEHPRSVTCPTCRKVVR